MKNNQKTIISSMKLLLSILIGVGALCSTTTDKKATITCASYSDTTLNSLPQSTDWGVSSVTEEAKVCSSFSVQWSNGKKQTFGK